MTLLTGLYLRKITKERILEKCYILIDIDEINFKKMTAVIKIPTNERKAFFEKCKLLVNESAKYHEPVRSLRFFLIFKYSIRKLIVKTLITIKRGEDYFPII